MRARADLLHLDLDAFFAAVEQRDKPSLRGRPVVVGGTGLRGVVATASYEARSFGVRSAMPIHQARQLCPNAAYLAPRFAAYQRASSEVMAIIRARCALVEQVSIDEAYADLSVLIPGEPILPPAEFGHWLRAEVQRVTGLTASVGLSCSKSIAKLAGELAKPNGMHVIEPDAVREFLDSLPVTDLPGVGPATAARLTQAGITQVRQLANLDETTAQQILGIAHGQTLWALAQGQDDRGLIAVRETKSVSSEETFAQDLRELGAMGREVEVLAARVGRRLAKHGWAGSTVTLKARYADFSLRTRSAMQRTAVSQPVAIARVARRLLAELDPQEWQRAGGIRLLGVGVSGLGEWVQPELLPEPEPPAELPLVAVAASPPAPSWRPGADVWHPEYGAGWVWGAGLGRVTVRFEGPGSPSGPVRTFASLDPELTPADPPAWPG